MASVIKADTIQTPSGGTPTVPTATVGDNSTKIATTEFVETSVRLPIAWAYFDSTGVLQHAYNIASAVWTAAGNATVTFVNPAKTSNYSVVASATRGYIAGYDGIPTTTTFYITVFDNAGTLKSVGTSVVVYET